MPGAELFDALLATLHAVAARRAGARVLVATEQRWDYVNERWTDSLARSQLEQVAARAAAPRDLPPHFL